MFVDKMVSHGFMDDKVVCVIKGILDKEYGKHEEEKKYEDGVVAYWYRCLQYFDCHLILTSYEKLKSKKNEDPIEAYNLAHKCWEESSIIPSFKKVMITYLRLSRSRSASDPQDVTSNEIDKFVEGNPIMNECIWTISALRDYQLRKNPNTNPEKLLYMFKNNYLDIIKKFKEDPIAFLDRMRGSNVPELLMIKEFNINFNPIDWTALGC